MRTKHINSLILSLIIFINSSYSSEFSQGLSNKTYSILKKAKLRKNQVAYHLIDLDSGKVKTSLNSSKLFLPASLSKISSSYFSLHILGKDYKFTTSLSHTGYIKNGVLKGDLYLYGDGDPMITNARLFNLVLALKEKGITSIDGAFYYDDSDLYKTNMISNLGMGDQTYNTGLGGLNTEFNRFQVWRSGHKRSTKKSQFTPIPSLESIKVEKTKSKFTPGRKYEYQENDSEIDYWKVSETLRYKVLDEVPIKNPGLFTANLFRKFSKSLGIELNSPSFKKLPEATVIIGKLQSKSAIDLIQMAMEYSNNLFSEILLLKAAQIKENKILNLKQSSTVMRDWMHKKFPNQGWNNSIFVNGSGLHTKNVLQPKTLSHFFFKTQYEKFGESYFWSLLSISGQSGWMRRRLNEPASSYKVWAKTGSLDYVANLSGYIFTNKNKRYAFSLFVNDFQKRKKLANPNSKAINKLRQKAPKWKQKVTPVMDDLIRHWIKTL